MLCSGRTVVFSQVVVPMLLFVLLYFMPLEQVVEDVGNVDDVPITGVDVKNVSATAAGSGSVEIRFLAPSIYIINFPSQRVRDWVLESGPWYFQHRAIILRKWMPGMMLDVLRLDSASVWVKLCYVPLELYSQQGLGYIASALGKPLYTDRATTLKNQLEYAKVCIEVGAKDDISDSVLVEIGDGRSVNAGVVSDVISERVVIEYDRGDQRGVCGDVQSRSFYVDIARPDVVMGSGLIGVSMDFQQTRPPFDGIAAVGVCNGQASTSKCPVLRSPNSFGVLSPEVQDIEVRGDSPRKGRVKA
ncbi:hypothetical protein V6N13_033343 [Hibiscus sabdariffa]